MALTDNAQRTKIAPDSIEPQIVTAETLHAGGYTMSFGENAAVAAEQGRLHPYTAESGAIPLGFNVKGSEPNTDPTVGDLTATDPPRGDVALRGTIVASLAVAGLAGDNTDMFKLVYATDDTTFTLTEPALGLPVAIVVKDQTSAVADVYFYSFAEMAVLSLAGGASQRILAGVISGISGGGGTFATGIEAQSNGEITSVYGIVIEPAVTGGADLDVNLEIGGVDVTGGVVNWVLADAAGDKKAGTAVTAANVVHKGDLIDIEVAETSASTGGLMAVYYNFKPLLGL